MRTPKRGIVEKRQRPRIAATTITRTMYTVAATREQAEALVSGTYSPHGKPLAATLSSRAAARIYKADVARIPSNPRMHVYPVRITFELGGKS